MIKKKIMSKSGKHTQHIQAYRCKNGHYFKLQPGSLWDDTFIEYVVYVYLRCLSLNTTIDLVRATYEEELLSKQLILKFIEQVADILPDLDDIDRIFSPQRSGYLALDGVWFNFRGEDIVLLVCFDPVSFDVITARWEESETEDGYTHLMKEVIKKIGKKSIKGAYGDGDNGLMNSLKKLLPEVPFQLCVVHKELRMGQLVPVKHVHRSRRMTEKVKQEILTFQELFRAIIYAESKPVATLGLEKLKTFVDRSSQVRFQKAYRSLRRNFVYVLTHFDHPEMMRDNNLIECFNGCLKPRLELMKGFKKKENLDRYLLLFLLEFRFRPLRESRFKERRGLTPLESGGVYLPKYYNFINFLRTQFNLSFQPPSP